MGPCPTRLAALAVALSVIAIAGEGRATDEAPSSGSAPGLAAPPSGPTAPEPAKPPPWRLGGYVETAWQWNFNRPANGLTNFRGFDNRHATFTLANAALDAAWEADGVVGRLALQAGTTPAVYYMAEPALGGSPSVNGSDATLWRNIQQAWAGYRAGRLFLSAGLFLSPVGPETIPIRESWSWSRSNLFFALPFYHTGARAALELGDGLALTAAVFNGWNSVVDNNDSPSLCLQLTLNRPTLALSALYLGGVERPDSDTLGRPWRHLFDLHAMWQVTRGLSLMAHANGGLERGGGGDAQWVAGAVYARVSLAERWALTGRLDALREWGGRRFSRVLLPVDAVGSGTLTAEFKVAEGLLLRLEGRHDRASDSLYFDADDAETPRARSQTTLTLGAITGW